MLLHKEDTMSGVFELHAEGQWFNIRVNKNIIAYFECFEHALFLFNAIARRNIGSKV